MPWAHPPPHPSRLSKLASRAATPLTRTLSVAARLTTPKKVIRLQYFELNPDHGITPTDCESRNEISSPGNDAEDAEEVSFVPYGPSRFSHAADVQMSPLTTAGVMRAMLRTKKHKVRACLLYQYSFVRLEYHRK